MISTTKRIFLIITIFSVLLIVFSSCKVHKPVQKTAKSKTATIIDDASSFYKVVTDNYPAYNTFLIKLSAEYTDKDQSQSLNGVIRINRDSMIWVSVTAILGYEIVRFIFTPDSVRFVNKVDNTYYLGNYDYLKRLFNISLDFYSLQALITDELFIYGMPEDDINLNTGFKLSADKGLQCLDYSNPPYDQRICIDPAGNKIIKLLITDNIIGRTMQVSYSEFMTENDANLPGKITIDLISDFESSKISVEYSKVILNKRLDFPFKILKEYQRIY